MTKPEMTSGHRAALTQQIAAQLGHDRATVLVAEKRRRTRTGVFLLLLSSGGAWLSARLGVNPLLTLGIGIGGGLLAATTWSGEYVKAAIRDLGTAVADVIRLIVRARKGNGDAAPP